MKQTIETLPLYAKSVALTLVLIAIAACTNVTGGQSAQLKADPNLCETYEMQEILKSDSNAERLRKLRENTYFHGECSQ